MSQLCCSPGNVAVLSSCVLCEHTLLQQNSMHKQKTLEPQQPNSLTVVASISGKKEEEFPHVISMSSMLSCPVLQQCKRLEKKRARQASDSLSGSEKMQTASSDEPGYLSKLRRSITSLRHSRR